MRKLIVTVAIASLFFASCKKDDESSNAVDPSNRKNVLTTGKWRITAHSGTYVQVNGLDKALDYYAKYKECEKDDLIIFPTLQDSSMRYAEGGVMCNSGEFTSGFYPSFLSYRLVENNSVLRYFDDNLNARDYHIDYMDNNLLKTTYTNTGTYNGNSFTEIIHIDYAHTP